MKMTDELAAKLLDYIEKTPKLYNDLEYLFKHKFVGFQNCLGKTIGEIVYSLNGWIGLCNTEIFLDEIQAYYGESEEELVERLSMYAINYLTCVAALDIFVSKFKDQYFDVQHLTRLRGGIHALYQNKIEFLLDDPNGGLDIKEAYFMIESDDYRLVDKALDLKLKVDVERLNIIGFGQWHIKVGELNKGKLEEMMLAAGW